MRLIILILRHVTNICASICLLLLVAFIYCIFKYGSLKKAYADLKESSLNGIESIEKILLFFIVISIIFTLVSNSKIQTTVGLHNLYLENAGHRIYYVKIDEEKLPAQIKIIMETEDDTDINGMPRSTTYVSYLLEKVSFSENRVEDFYGNNFLKIGKPVTVSSDNGRYECILLNQHAYSSQLFEDKNDDIVDNVITIITLAALFLVLLVFLSNIFEESKIRRYAKITDSYYEKFCKSLHIDDRSELPLLANLALFLATAFDQRNPSLSKLSKNDLQRSGKYVAADLLGMSCHLVKKQLYLWSNRFGEYFEGNARKDIKDYYFKYLPLATKIVLGFQNGDSLKNEVAESLERDYMRGAFEILDNDGNDPYYSYCSSQIQLDKKNNSFVDVGNRIITGDSMEIFVRVKSFFEAYSEHIEIACMHPDSSISNFPKW